VDSEPPEQRHDLRKPLRRGPVVHCLMVFSASTNFNQVKQDSRSIDRNADPPRVEGSTGMGAPSTSTPHAVHPVLWCLMAKYQDTAFLACVSATGEEVLNNASEWREDKRSAWCLQVWRHGSMRWQEERWEVMGCWQPSSGHLIRSIRNTNDRGSCYNVT